MGKLLNLLIVIRVFKATDQEDRIYAILGITVEGLELGRLSFQWCRMVMSRHSTFSAGSETG
jgi:hypothetical protein